MKEILMKGGLKLQSLWLFWPFFSCIEDRKNKLFIYRAFGNNLNKLMIAKDLNQISTRNFENHAEIGGKIL